MKATALAIGQQVGKRYQHHPWGAEIAQEAVLAALVALPKAPSLEPRRLHTYLRTSAHHAAHRLAATTRAPLSSHPRHLGGLYRVQVAYTVPELAAPNPWRVAARERLLVRIYGLMHRKRHAPAVLEVLMGSPLRSVARRLKVHEPTLRASVERTVRTVRGDPEALRLWEEYTAWT